MITKDFDQQKKSVFQKIVVGKLSGLSDHNN